jgi:diguanylate cyclase (GGDEF)-like protein/PAS domain S-box-containing protein
MSASSSPIGRETRSRIITFCMITGITALLLAGLYFWSRQFVIQGFLDVEHDLVVTDTLRVRDAIHNEVVSLGRTAGDWAGWDDTYYFMAGENPDYIDSNLMEDTYAGLNLNLVALLDTNGQAMYGMDYDPTTEAFSELPPGFIETIDPLLPLDDPDGMDGIVSVSGQTYMVAARPIYTSLMEGPSNGTLIFGRRIDEREITRLQNETHADFTLSLTSPSGASDAVTAGHDGLGGHEDVDVIPQSTDVVSGFTIMPAIIGGQRFQLQVDAPRDVLAQGLATLRHFGVSLLLIGAAVILISQVLVDRLLLTRLAQLQLEAEYQALAERAAIILVEPDSWAIVQANSAAARLVGVESKDLDGRNLLSLPSLPQDQVVPILNRTMRSKEGYQGHFTWERPEQDNLELDVSVHAIRISGRPLLMIVSRDVTEKVQAEEALRESEERYALASRGANDGLWDWDLKTDSIHLSERWKAIIGYEPDAIGTDPSEWTSRVHRDDRESFLNAIRRHIRGNTDYLEHEHRLRHRDRSYRWVLCRGMGVRNDAGRITRMSGSLTDITQRKLAEQKLAFEAMHDPLTSLPNRALFVDRLQQSIERVRRRPGSGFAVLFLDLDRFKVVNDSLGHLAGDRVLVEVAHRLDRGIRDEDTVARFGGDEFAVLMAGAPDSATVMRFAERLQSLISDPIVVAGQRVFSSASIGIAPFQQSYRRADEMLRDADIAMYRAKARGPGQSEVFDQELHTIAATQLRLEDEIRRALDRQEFTLLYQPVYSLDDFRVRSLEALVRWQHPTRGLLSPDVFIPLAEETGLILPIGRWAILEACRQLGSWLPLNPDLSVSVNLSGRQFSDPKLLPGLTRSMSRFAIPAKHLILEVTESSIIGSREAPVLMNQLKDLGAELSLDDFGRGYSSLSYLDQYPLDIVKIDKSFIAELSASRERQAITRAIIELGRALKMRVVAEGIETEEQLTWLLDAGCRFGQGFFFCKPLSPGDIDARCLLVEKQDREVPVGSGVTRPGRRSGQSADGNGAKPEAPG